MERRLGWGEGRLRVKESSERTAYGLRVLNGGRQGIVTTFSDSPESLRSGFTEAIGISRTSPQDANKVLATSPSNPQDSIPTDSSLFNPDENHRETWLEQ